MSAPAYEPQGILVDVFTQDEVESLLAKAKKVFLEQGAAQVTNWATGGMTATKKLNLTALEMIAECRYALQRLDPESYPATPDITTVKFT